MKKQFSFEYQLFENEAGLGAPERALLSAAREATNLSYAPYSKFHVGAAVLLSNGVVIKGSNQENASFPAGICAERVALSTVSSLYPSEKIIAMAIAYRSQAAGEEDPILSPCGICRQSLMEVSTRQQTPITLWLTNRTGNIVMVENTDALLPLAFSAKNL